MPSLIYSSLKSAWTWFGHSTSVAAQKDRQNLAAANTEDLSWKTVMFDKR